MQGTAAFEEDTGFKIEKSLKFEDGDLKKGSAPAGNLQVFTISFWMKTSRSGARLYGDYTDGNNYVIISHDYASDDGKIAVQAVIGGTDYRAVSLAQFRDPSAWYHVVLRFDTTRSTEADRYKLYINA